MRSLVEKLVLLGCLLLFVQSWYLQGLVFPLRVVSGSMAPTLLGPHHLAMCPRCQHPFFVGCDPVLDASLARCPKCEYGPFDATEGPKRAGDRVLVDRAVYLFREPKRFEVVAFCGAGGRPHVKRIIGLPGETISIRDGRVYVNGNALRDSGETQLAIFPLQVTEPWPIRDDYEFNAGLSRALNVVDDVEVAFRAYIGTGSLVLCLGPKLVARLENSSEKEGKSAQRDSHTPTGIRQLRASVSYDGRCLMSCNVPSELASGWRNLKFGRRGGRISLTIDERKIIDIPCDFDDTSMALAHCLGEMYSQRSQLNTSTTNSNKFRKIKCDGTLPAYDCLGPDLRVGKLAAKSLVISKSCRDWEVRDVRLAREIYYLPPNSKTSPNASDWSIRLREGEYLVLGDNSALSDDSDAVLQRKSIFGRALRAKQPIVNLVSD